MKLPIALEMEPMLSAPADGIPKGDSWSYEPKWDGFRTLVFRDGDDVALISRGSRPMTRYFPEVLPAFRGLSQSKLVLDGELVVVGKKRTADCVVIGWRKSNDGQSLGSLLLGLYDRKGTLHYVGHTSSFNAAERKELIAKLKPLATAPPKEWSDAEGRMPGGPSRWSRGKETEWMTVRPELVCEVAYDKLEAGERFRHATRFLRWRTDKPPRKCGFDQIASAVEFDVRGIFRSK